MNRTAALFALVVLAVVSPARAQRFSWPEKPENLQVLEGMTGQELRPIMREFTQALGVRCSYCHVGEEGQSLAEFDFVSDLKPEKVTTRSMMRMAATIEQALAELPREDESKTPVEFGCVTCHRGRPRPTSLVDELTEAYAEGGVEEALATYDGLKEKFLLQGCYDFREPALNDFAYTLLESGDTDGAIRALTKNAELFPESGNVWDSLAEATLAAGDPEQARIYYKKALELDPRNRNAAAKLESLER